MTVFRRLQKLNYLSSYTHAGRYYTLAEIAQFDRTGLWFYDDIGFSEKCSLKNTIDHLVDTCDAGKFHRELEKQLRVRVHNALLDLVTSNQIYREQFQGSYLYLSIAPDRREKQMQRRQELALQASGFSEVLSEHLIIEVLSEVIRQSTKTPNVEQVTSSLCKRGLIITEHQVGAIFKQYKVEKKTSR